MTLTQHKSLAIGIAIFLLLVVFSCSSFLQPNTRHLTGRIVSLDKNIWGLTVDWQWYRPFAERHYRVVELPADYQQAGRRIVGTFHVVEVLGRGKWDVLVKAEHVQTKGE